MRKEKKMCLSCLGCSLGLCLLMKAERITLGVTCGQAQEHAWMGDSQGIHM